MGFAELIPAPEAIVLDLIEPDSAVFNVCVKLKQNTATKSIPIFFIVEGGNEKDAIRCLEIGATEYITKPLSPKLLLARLRNRLALSFELKELQKENTLLYKSLRLREDLEKVARHDLKGPLTAMINIERILVQSNNLLPDQIELLEHLSESAHRMLEMINRTTSFYQIEHETYQFIPVQVNLVKVVFQVFQEFQKAIAAKNLRWNLFVNDLPASGKENFAVEGEDLLFFFMLSNLIKNAIEASPEGEEINVSLEDAMIPTISIQNRGAIPESIRDNIFEKYTTVGKEGGTGLGVYSAQMLAKTVGGKITFVTSEDKGTTFQVSLPPRDAMLSNASPVSDSPADAENESVAENQKSRLKVLVVDDYPFMRRIMVNILQQDGFADVLEAADGAEAIALLEKTPVDLILSDWFMPGKSGMDILEFMQNHENLKDIPFIMITANLSLPEFEKAADKGLRNYLPKPFSADILKKKIKSVLSKTLAEGDSK
ncbi:MAG: response regulator [Candidatus Rifleibacteriota bacterium]